MIRKYFCFPFQYPSSYVIEMDVDDYLFTSLFWFDWFVNNLYFENQDKKKKKKHCCGQVWIKKKKNYSENNTMTQFFFICFMRCFFSYHDNHFCWIFYISDRLSLYYLLYRSISIWTPFVYVCVFPLFSTSFPLHKHTHTHI